MSQRSEQINELAAALAAAQAEFSAVPKGSDNEFFKSKYADLADVIKTGSPVAAKHGLAVTQWIGFDDKGDVLTTVLLHTSGQFVSDTMRLHSSKLDRQGNILPPDPQALGSATTYGRRQAYMAALGLVADVDDDGNKTRSTAPAAKAASAPPKPQPQAASSQAPGQGQRPASSNQRGLIYARAGAVGLSPSALADVVLGAMGSKPRKWDDEQTAQDWLRRALDRLPATSVDTVLEGIQRTTGQEALLPVGQEADGG